jgi:hypothetical protein
VGLFSSLVVSWAPCSQSESPLVSALHKDVPVEVRSAIAGGVVALGIALGDGLLGRDSEPRRKKAFCGHCEVKQL